MTTATAMRCSTASGRPVPSATPGAETCFAPWLWRVVKSGKRRAPRVRTSSPPGCGTAAAARKVGEEGLEAALAGAGEPDERLIEEVADLWFHSYVLLAARGLDPSAVEDELRRRHPSRGTTDA